MRLPRLFVLAILGVLLLTACQPERDADQSLPTRYSHNAEAVETAKPATATVSPHTTKTVMIQHQVKPHETLTGVGGQYGKSWSQLYQLNSETLDGLYRETCTKGKQRRFFCNPHIQVPPPSANTLLPGWTLIVGTQEDPVSTSTPTPAEIDARVKNAGGTLSVEDGLRTSLGWNSCDDLDLHVQSSTEHVYWENKEVESGGNLDIDQNAGDCDTRKPVENIVWASMPPGTYAIFVQNFAYHDIRTNGGKIPFTVVVNGQRFSGEIYAGETREDSNVLITTFTKK